MRSQPVNQARERLFGQRTAVAHRVECVSRGQLANVPLM